MDDETHVLFLAQNLILTGNVDFYSQSYSIAPIAWVCGSKICIAIKSVIR